MSLLVLRRSKPSPAAGYSIMADNASYPITGSSVSFGSGENAYWDLLVAHAKHHDSISFRTQQEIDDYTKSATPVNPATYDATEDAAKWVTGGLEINSKDQLRYPFTAISSGNFLAYWEGKFGVNSNDYDNYISPLLQMKAFQLSDSADTITCEPKWWFAQGSYNPKVCQHGIRLYTAQGMAATSGENNPLDDETGFQASVNVWVKHWIFLDYTASTLTFWMADETAQTPVRVHDQSSLSSTTGIANFWYELNSSQSNSGQSIDYWGRNFAILKDVGNGITGAQAIVDQVTW